MASNGITDATGPCIRCGASQEDVDVVHVRGANLCQPCLARGVSPRYDAAVHDAARAEVIRVKTARDKNGPARDGMRAVRNG